jgi:hypothetical protein
MPLSGLVLVADQRRVTKIRKAGADAAISLLPIFSGYVG